MGTKPEVVRALAKRTPYNPTVGKMFNY